MVEALDISAVQALGDWGMRRSKLAGVRAGMARREGWWG